MAKQTSLEKKGIEKRGEYAVKNDYSKFDAYSENHKDALSDPNDENKVLGKGTGHGGHTHSVPDSTKSSTAFTYDIDTTAGGGAYDIHGRNNSGGRNRLVQINLYSAENPYGADSIDTTFNQQEGQYIVK